MKFKNAECSAKRAQGERQSRPEERGGWSCDLRSDDWFDVSESNHGKSANFTVITAEFQD